MIPSLFNDQDKLLQAIIDLHLNCNDIELDPMYNKGNFYKGSINKPIFRYDIDESYTDCLQADARYLPHNSSSIKSMILDPPFMFNWHGQTKNYTMSKNYGIYRNFDDLFSNYSMFIAESSRILVKNGILIFKCQDFTDSKTTLTHCYVWGLAIFHGFYVKDLAILHYPNRIWNSHLNQRHFRKTHSYFFVFQNKK